MSEFEPGSESEFDNTLQEEYIMSQKIKNGRKVDASIENPIDNVMIYISEAISPYFRRMGYTPNGLTTISLFFGIAALYSLYNYDVILFAVYFALAHLFDCMDGYYARKYNMVTDGGDKYDHFKDLIVAIAGLYIIYDRYNVLAFPVLLIIMLVMMVLSMMSVGCHEKITHPDHKSDTLQAFNIVTPSRDTCMNYTRYLRFFGPGTFVLAVIIAVFYLNSYIANVEVINEPIYMNISDNKMRDILDISKPFNGFTTNTFGSTSLNPFL